MKKDALGGQHEQYDQNKQIINLIVPESVYKALDVTIGKANQKLCFDRNGIPYCYRARIVAMARKFPAFVSFSRYYPFSFTSPDAIITTDQMKWLIKDLILQEKELFSNVDSQLNLPMKMMLIDTAEDTSPSQELALRSFLQSQIKPDSSLIFNSRVLIEINTERMNDLLAFFNIIIAMLYVLSFYQLILSIDANLNDNIYQIGVLRSMGVTKKDVLTITQIEASANILAATILGFFTGYAQGIISVTMLNTIFEIPVDRRVNWPKLGFLIGISFIIVHFGTRLSVSLVNRKKISSILKGI